MKPIKRHPALVELSKDHHFGLLLSWKIRKGNELNVDISRVIDYIVYVFENDLEFHFKEEEELLFNQLPVNDSQRIRAEKEHALIRDLVQKIQVKNSPELLEEFSTILQNHIRFEERELFNHMQETFSNEVLENISEQLKNRQRPQVGMWRDPFWE